MICIPFPYLWTSRLYPVYKEHPCRHSVLLRVSKFIGRRAQKCSGCSNEPHTCGTHSARTNSDWKPGAGQLTEQEGQVEALLVLHSWVLILPPPYPHLHPRRGHRGEGPRCLSWPRAVPVSALPLGKLGPALCHPDKWPPCLLRRGGSCHQNHHLFKGSVPT